MTELPAPLRDILQEALRLADSAALRKLANERMGIACSIAAGQPVSWAENRAMLM